MPDVVGLEAELTLTIDRALAEVSTLEQALTSATTGIPVSLDFSGVDQAVATIPTSIEAAVAAITPIVDVTADTTAAEQLILSLSDQPPVDVPVDANTQTAEASIASLETSIPPILLDVEADTTGAETAVADLGAEASSANENVAGLEGSVAGLGAAAGITEGSAKELVSTIGELGGESTKVAAGGILAVAGATAGFFEEGLNAVSAGQRFDLVLGDMAGKIKEIDVNGLNTSVEDLGISFGSTGSEMENVNSKLFQNAVNAGISKDKAVEFTQQIETLSARAISLNPQLGTLADVSSNLGDKLARGGRFAQNYGIQLTAAEINTRALADTGKEAASDLTIVEKSIAGAELASEKYGSTLAGTVAEGQKNAAIQAEELKARFKEAIEQIGVPIVAPVLDLLREAEPDAVAIAKVLGELGKDALPVVAAALDVLGPPLQLVGAVLDAIPSPVVTATIGFYALNTALALFTEQVIGVELALAPELVILVAVAAALASFTGILGDSGPLVDDVTKAIDGQASGFDDLTRSVKSNITAEIEAAEKAGDFTKRLNDAHVSSEDLNDALIKGGDAYHQLGDRVAFAAIEQGASLDTVIRITDELGHLRDATNDAAQSTLDRAVADQKITQADVDAIVAVTPLIDGHVNYASVLAELQPRLDAATTGTDGLTVAEEKAKQATKDHADAIQHLEDVMKSALDGTFAAFQAELRLSDARITAKKRIDDYAKANADGTKTQDELTMSLNDARQAALDQAQANVDLQEAQDKANGITETASQKQEAYVRELQSVTETLDPSNPLRIALDSYIYQIASTPTDKHTDFQVEVDDALRKWNDYITQLQNGTPYEIETIFNVRTPGPKAAGGPVEPNTPYLVGEVGAELFIPKVPGVIIPNYVLRQETDKAGPTASNVTPAEGPLIGTMIIPTAAPTATANVVLQKIAAARRFHRPTR